MTKLADDGLPHSADGNAVTPLREMAVEACVVMNTIIKCSVLTMVQTQRLQLYPPKSLSP